MAQVLKNTPKCLAPVLDTDFLSIILQNLNQFPVKRAILSLHHMADQIVGRVENIRGTGLLKYDLDYVVEPTPLGTGGAIKYCLSNKEISQRFIVLNADTFVTGDLNQLFHSSQNTIGIVYQKDLTRFGSVEVNHEMRIMNFTEKSALKSPGYINAGYANLNHQCFEGKYGPTFSLELDVYSSLVRRENLFGRLIQGTFCDIGVPEDYAAFCNWYANLQQK